MTSIGNGKDDASGHGFQAQGFDVSKDHLEAARHPGGEIIRVANTRKCQTALLHWMGHIRAVARVVFEPTGGRYHRTLEERLAFAGVPVIKVNPRQALRFAEATDKLAKTDRVDVSLNGPSAR
ncbi:MULTISPECIES: transposase [Acetobacteraceae]|uniref:IS110 family transposase n=1 Tax=Acetobacteraceae TaxID=433 RepID=UPI00062C4423|nr:transposase [Acetobacter senegalensis]MCG4261949.1 transposase [Acetobacter senegalensis]